MKYEGKLMKMDLGPGMWILRTKDFEYPLDGAIPADLEGAQVIVEGTKSKKQGISMLGDASIKVDSVRKAGA